MPKDILDNNDIYILSPEQKRSIQAGLEEIENGNVISHEDVLMEIEKLLEG